MDERSRAQPGSPEPAADRVELFTVGHSNHPLERFLELLREYRIDVIADVRSHPYSRFASHFSQGPLRKALAEAGVGYVFLGETLGGRPSDPGCYDTDGHVDYRAVSQAAWFGEGLERLRRGARECRVAVMCGEEDPTSCHRRLLVGRVLDERGDVVRHLRGDGAVQDERDLTETQPDQLNLFGSEERPWRSVRSVLRDGPPEVSSSD